MFYIDICAHVKYYEIINDAPRSSQGLDKQMFTEITHISQFKEISGLLTKNNAFAEYLYDCGSSTTTLLPYTTNTFKKHLKISEVGSRISKCIGVETDFDLSFLASKVEFNFSYEHDGPFAENPFFSFLVDASQNGTLSNYFDENKNAFLLSIGYEPGTHKLQTKIQKDLRAVHEHFWFLKHNNKLPKPSTIEHTETLAISKDDFDIDSIEYEIASLIHVNQRLNLPETKLKHYAAIKKMMEKAGGKYKKLGFEFSAFTDINALLINLLNGNKVNIKQEYQFFETPSSEAEQMVLLSDLKEGERWLEPSAGKGMIAKYANMKSANGTLVEIMPENIKSLTNDFDIPLYTKSFLECTEKELRGKFDKIIANPPFSKNQDIKHFLHMVDLLKDTGRVVCITSTHWEHSSTNICEAFRAWLKACNASLDDIEAGAFKSSGTNIATKRIVLDKQNVRVSFEEFSTSFFKQQAA